MGYILVFTLGVVVGIFIGGLISGGKHNELREELVIANDKLHSQESACCQSSDS